VSTLRRLAFVTAGAVLCHGLQTVSAEGAWDCRAAAPGAGWECRVTGDAPPSRTASPAPASAAAPAPVAPTVPATPVAAPAPAALPEAAPPAPVPPASPSSLPVAEPAAVSPATSEPLASQPPPAAPVVVDPPEPPTARAASASSTPSAPPAKPPKSPKEAKRTPLPTARPAATVQAVPRDLPIGASTIPVPSSIDDGLVWTYCGPPPPGATTDRPAVSETPGELVEAEADSAEGRLGDEVVSLSGDVRVQQGSDLLRADRAEYDRAANVVDAQGNVLVVRPDLRVAGETARLDMAAEKGEITGAEYRLVGTNARGTAEVAHFRDKARSDYQNVTYTTCRPGREDWVLKARELQIDRVEGLADAKDATLKLGDVPVAYLPSFSFPIDDRRRSGWLVPRLGFSDSRGVELRVPYYFNLAPNYDATLTPGYLSKRGPVLGAELRHMTDTSQSLMRGEILPEDQERPDLGVRGALSVQHRQYWGALSADVNFNQVSDDYYLTDFGRSFTQSSMRYLTRRASVGYAGDDWRVSALVSDYQSVDPTVNPYRLLPSIAFVGRHRQPIADQPVELGLGASYTNFSRDVGTTGQRLDLYPSVSLPLRTSWGFAVPKVGVRYTNYRLDDQAPGEPDSPDRTLGIASFDSGLFLERESEWLGSPMTQTLEPRLYYVYIPRVDQNDIPIFDTNQYDPVFDSYFVENVFTGPDRVNDANRLSLGLTTRFIPHDSGIELLRLSLGQVFFFEDRLVQLPGNPPGTSAFSPTLGEIGVHLDRRWSASASGQWDVLNDADNNNLLQQTAYRIAYNGDDGRFVRARYGKSQDVTEYTDLAFTWPVSEQVSLIGRWAYSLDLDENMEALAGIEYGSCCWRVRAFARRYLKTVSTNNGQAGEQDTSFLVQLELRGLGAVGDDIEELLDRSLQGFVEDRDHGNTHVFPDQGYR